jgi:phosphotransferase family enzyme
MADRIILSREDASTVASQNSYRSPGGHRGASIFLFRSPPQRCVRANRVLRDCRQPHIIDNLGRTRVVDEQLHPGNLLVSDGHLSGVIDFGDLTCGDPATDVSVLWMLPRSIRSKFEAWAGEEPDALKMRACGWASRWDWRTWLTLATMLQWRPSAKGPSMPCWMNRRSGTVVVPFESRG